MNGSVAPAASNNLFGCHARQLTAPIRCPKNPSWYRITFFVSPSKSKIFKNWA